MKKILFVALLALAGIYGTGYASLGESGVNGFLNNLMTLTADGNGHALCELLSDDIKVDLNDHTASRGGKFSGGKQEFCEYSKTAAAGVAVLKPSLHVERKDMKIKRDWLHPWTAEVTYTELMTMTIPRANLTIKTESDDQVILVRTLSGVKIQRLQSEVWAQ
jgi:hypothetical protein